MVGFGPEDNHFVVELTYNYGIGTYQIGNDFKVCSISYMYHEPMVHIFNSFFKIN